MRSTRRPALATFAALAIAATGLLGLRRALALPCFLAVWWWMGRHAPALARADLLKAAGLGMLGYHLASWMDFQGLQYVDVATELTRMIINQNGYQANSRVLTTANTLLQEVLNLIR